mmetsp:Transcript_6453/g.14089  ORF Transcript_6453/g.14089 Transcript_6453/m.14089 type:complete len:271 (-) Transcript_6453:114-926(-)
MAQVDEKSPLQGGSNEELLVTQKSLMQQGYDYSPSELSQLSWGLRFTPTMCMIGALIGLYFRLPYLHFTLAALGIIPFWFPSWHPLDRFYNGILRPLWHGVELPPNPLPRRIACFMGGLMNIFIGCSFLANATTLAYIFGGILITLQIVVITTHFCVASWLYEGVLRMIGRYIPPISSARAHELVEQQGALLVDVREPNEFAKGHIVGAVNYPLSEVEHGVWITKIEEAAPKAVVLYCQSGLRTQRAIALLKKDGGVGKEVYSLGAMSRW